MKNGVIQLPVAKKASESDILGAIAGGLCLIHCIATPFLFMMHTCKASCCSAAPGWWGYIDFLFLVISFIALYQTTRNTNSKWIGATLYAAWILLLLVIVNEKTRYIEIPEETVYLPALALITLHLYNRRYCRCQKKQCCSNS